MDDVQLFLAMNVDSGGNPVLCPCHPDVGRGRDGGVYGVWLCVLIQMTSTWDAFRGNETPNSKELRFDLKSG